jgi:hydroxyacylglutathione hydrolase
MPHVVQRPNAPFLACDGRLRVHQVPAATDNLIWIAECVATGQAAIVDGPDADAALVYLHDHGLKLTTVLNTHTHGDHVGVNRDLKRRGLLRDLRVIGPRRAASDVPGLTDPVDEGDTVRIGEVEGEVWLTEGHLNGHISFVFGDVVFCGDTMFAGGCGYLFDGPPQTMFRSLIRLAGLAPSTRVCCAHEYTEDNLRFAWLAEPGNEALAERIRAVWAIRADGGCTVPSTIADERATNPFIRPGAPTLVARVRDAMPDADLSTPGGVFAATREWKNRGAHKALTDADLPLG